jgi:RimJ/RimL family protein N-acetyltransferase
MSNFDQSPQQGISRQKKAILDALASGLLSGRDDTFVAVAVPELPLETHGQLKTGSGELATATDSGTFHNQACKGTHGLSTTSAVVAALQILDHRSPPSMQVAKQMVSLIDQTYKGRYPYQQLLDPMNLIEGVKSGKYTFAVVFDDSGKLLGMAGISDFTWLGEEVTQYGQVKEIGKLIVAEDARGYGLGGILTKACVEHLQSEGVEIFAALTMTSHDHSQRAFARLGFVPTGITVCDWPNVLNDAQRESSVIMYRIENEAVRKDRPIFVPESLRVATEIAVEAAGCVRTFKPGELPSIDAATGLLPSTNFEYESLSTQVFLTDPMSVETAIADAEETIQQGSLHVSITVDVGQPSAFSALQRLVDEGYAYSSFHPLPNGDLLTVQKVVEPPHTYVAGIKCACEASGRLLVKISQQISES